MPETETTPSAQALIDRCLLLASQLAYLKECFSGTSFDGHYLNVGSRQLFDMLESVNGHETEWRYGVDPQTGAFERRAWMKTLPCGFVAFCHEAPQKAGGVSEIVESLRETGGGFKKYDVGLDGLARERKGAEA